MSVPARNNRIKFFIVGGLLLIGVVFIVISTTQATADFFMTVEELNNVDSDLTGKNLRVSGAVLGETIHYDTQTGMLHFIIAHISADEDEIEAQGGLEAALHQAVINPDAPRLEVVYAGATTGHAQGRSAGHPDRNTSGGWNFSGGRAAAQMPV